MRKAFAVPALGAAMIIGGAQAAVAAPPEREVIPLHCDDGQVYTVEVNGNGAFTPGRVVDSTAVVIPVAFGEFHFRAEAPDGTVLEEGSEPGEEKGGGNVVTRSPRATTTCSFELTMELEEPEDGFPAGTTLFFGGTVTVQVVGMP